MVYLHQKRNRRVNVLLVTLLRISRDKAFERFHKLETGKQTHRMCEINRRHKAAELMQLSNNCQVTVSEIEWRVQSQSQQHIHYQIKQQNDHCECRVTCSSCLPTQFHMHMFRLTPPFNSMQAYPLSRVDRKEDNLHQECTTNT